jgi:hypothetical protein
MSAFVTQDVGRIQAEITDLFAEIPRGNSLQRVHAESTVGG